MGYTLNVDLWNWVNPETQKVVQLRRGDKVPSEVLQQDGIDVDALCEGPKPVFLKGTGDDEKREAGTPTRAASESQQQRSTKEAESK